VKGLAEAVKGSHEERNQLLLSSLRALMDENEYPWIRATFDDSVVYERRQNGKYVTFRRTYTIDDEGKVTFGEPQEVRVTEDVEPVTESTVQVQSELIPLVEAANSQGLMLMKLIAPGWSLNSRYYSEAVLKRDIAKIFPKGTHVYVNHQTEAEETARPEGDLRDLAAVFESKPEWRTEPAGPGMYAKIRVFEHWRPFVAEVKEHIGSSIRSWGLGKDGEVEGRFGTIIERLTGGKSVDLVTLPGAGGKVMDLLEAARTHPHQPDPPATDPKETEVDAEQLNEAIKAQVTEAVKPLQDELTSTKTELAAVKAENARMVEAGRSTQARDKALKLIAESGLKALPDTAKARIATAVAANPPLTESGTIDETKLAEAVKTTANTEAAYLEAAGWQRPGIVTGMGDTDPFATTAEVKDEDLVAGYNGLFGLSESGAKRAVAGRL
jgi:hypothetical protein